jgi:dipeptide/tripeptide permease
MSSANPPAPAGPAATPVPPLPSGPDPNRWPKQVRFILGNEAAERFSYYGMKGILALYITNILLQTRDYATSVIHLFGFVNYFMPMVGAWVSDRLWGRYHTILWISLSYCAGHGVMAMSDLIPGTDGKLMCLWVGLGLIAFGSGGIKPCVSAFMGDQFRPDQRHLLQKAYAAFYWSINLGSTAAFFVIPFIRKSFGYSWAFGVPGIAMAIATFIFWLGTRRYVRVKPAGDPRWLWKICWLIFLVAAVVVVERLGRKLGLSTTWRVIMDGAAALLIIAGVTKKFIREVDRQDGERPGAFFAVFWYGLTKFVWNGLTRAAGGGFWAAARKKFTATSVEDTISVWRILSIFALVPVFWALFDQTFSTWVLQAEKMESFFFTSDSRYGSVGLRNPEIMRQRLAAHTNAATAFVWSQLPATRQDGLTNQAPGSSSSSRALKTVLITELNKIINSGTSIYESNRFHGITLSGEARLLIAELHPSANATNAVTVTAPNLDPVSVRRLNRLLLDDVFPNETMPIYRIGPEEMLSMNPILVMLLVPVMTLLLYPAMGRLATPLRRMSFGMFLSASSFVIVAAIQTRIDQGDKLSIMWQTLPYVVLTIAEVLVSTTGLEFAFREAAPAMKSTIMGFWNLTVAFGNLLVTVITALAARIFTSDAATGDVSIRPAMFNFYAGLTFVVAVLFSIVCAFYKYRDESAAQGR